MDKQMPSSSSPTTTIRAMANTITTRNGDSSNNNDVVSVTKNHDTKNNGGRQQQQQRRRQVVVDEEEDNQDHHHTTDDIQDDEEQPITKKLKLLSNNDNDHDDRCAYYAYDLCQRLLFSPRRISPQTSTSSTDDNNGNDNNNDNDNEDDDGSRGISPSSTTTIPHSLLYETSTTDDGSSRQQQQQSQSQSPPPRRRRISLKNNVHTLRKIFDVHGFRTSIISSPRIGLSIYKDSFVTTTPTPPPTTTTTTTSDVVNILDDGRVYLITMFGLHEQQLQLEHVYKTQIKDIYCLWLFCQRIMEVMMIISLPTTPLPTTPLSTATTTTSTTANNDHHNNHYNQLGSFINSLQTQCYDILIRNSTNGEFIMMMDNDSSFDIPKLSISNVSKYVTELIDMVYQQHQSHKKNQQHIQHSIRKEQLQREYDRIQIHNSTLSNALLTKFISAHNNDLIIKDVYFKHCHNSNNPNQNKQYERITIYLYDPTIDQYSAKPTSAVQFIFMPCIHILMNYGIQYLVENYILKTFYQQLLHIGGYYISKEMKVKLHQPFIQFFTSGIISSNTTTSGTNPNLNLPYQLNAHFTPTSPLSLYLHGKAGSGKSSFVRNLPPALEATIEEYTDPEILVRFVKQNLNKRMEVLELELQLRPNNNDLSVMSIIQGRRMTMSQSKPGLVVVDLEEMPSNDRSTTVDPNQLLVAQLISQRFAGRKGQYKSNSASSSSYSSGRMIPRNSEKRGIQNDASIPIVLTSNYNLDPLARDALKRLNIFGNLAEIEVKAVEGNDRTEFANSYIRHQCNLSSCSDIVLNIPIGEGDIRPLVRHLRMISFYINSLLVTANDDSVVKNVHQGKKVTVFQEGQSCIVTVGERKVDLKLGTLENLFPLTRQVFDSRVTHAIQSVRDTIVNHGAVEELSTILDFWFAKTLAPTVIISNDEQKIQKLAEAAGALRDVHFIPSVDAGVYKMMKSLYDPNETPNLRDDILAYGRGSFVVVELKCLNNDAQLCIREIIEDSPSMTAFSTGKSALYKAGLLFAVYVKGDITPEVLSRASLVL